MWYEFFIDNGLVPFFLIKRTINLFNKNTHRRLKKTSKNDIKDFINEISHGPIAYDSDIANLQHYEVPSEFFQKVLGDKLKYSSGYWLPETNNINQAEIAMLELYVERAEINDGTSVLDLGCGWGSVSLYLANKFPKCQITCVSNSSTQIEYIKSYCLEKNITNVTPIKCDINTFTPTKKFDRIISIEMFEHMHNLTALLERISEWMSPNANLFIHIFSHIRQPYFFNNNTWMAKHFFQSGMMPNYELFTQLESKLKLVNSWKISGQHYEKTLNFWLEKLTKNKKEILDIFKKDVNEKKALVFWRRWRIFFVACASLFGFKKGSVWIVAHHKFELKNE